MRKRMKNKSSFVDTDGVAHWWVAGFKSRVKVWPEAPLPSRMELDSSLDAIIDQFIIVPSDMWGCCTESQLPLSVI